MLIWNELYSDMHLRRDKINSRFSLLEKLSGYTHKYLIFMSIETL